MSIFYRSYEELKENVVDEFVNKLDKHSTEQLLRRAKNIQQEYKNFELIVKKDANSLYGTSANEFLSLVDYDVATDITQTGKHFTVIVDIAINNFFVNWGDDELAIIKEFYPECTGIKKFSQYEPDTENDLCFYGDTDSRYVDLYMIYELIEGVEFPVGNDNIESKQKADKELSDFGLFIIDKFINGVISETLLTDINYRNGNVGYMKMTHEVTTRKNIVQNKKKYVFAAIWKDGKQLNQPTLTIKGVELKKGELNPRIKKIIRVLVDKFLIDDKDISYIRNEILKLISYIKLRKEKDLIYKIVGVSKFDLISFDEQKGEYISAKNYQSINVAKSWFNFVHKNGLQGEYRMPFEGQKMNHYYDINNKVIGIPDDININSIKNLPEPNWNKMINDTLVKSLLRYLLEDKEIDDKKIEYFLLGLVDLTKSANNKVVGDDDDDNDDDYYNDDEINTTE